MPEGVEVRVPITDCILKDWQGNEVKFEGGLKFKRNTQKFGGDFSNSFVGSVDKWETNRSGLLYGPSLSSK